MDHPRLLFIVFCLTTSVSLIGAHHSFADKQLVEIKKTESVEQPVIHDSRSLFGQLKLSDVKQSGEKLINLPLGLHQLSQSSSQSKMRSNKHRILSTRQHNHHLIDRQRITLLVHGYKSRGYEWIYAIKQFTLVSDVFFLRWNWSLCPEQAALILSQHLQSLQKRYPQSKVDVYGHSYGGVITAISAANYLGDTPLAMNVIASPVAGHPRLEARCSQSMKRLTEKLNLKNKSFNFALSLYQWRTKKELDGAFRDMDHNPQIVDWHGEVTQLPTSYKGHRLGHNWSISWVTDQILKQAQ